MRWRNRLLLLALAVLEVAVMVGLFVSWQGRREAPRPLSVRAAVSASDTEEPSSSSVSTAPSPSASALPRGPGSLLAPSPSGPAPRIPGPPDAAPAAAKAAILPEHVAELDVLMARPPDSEGWSADRKSAYIKQAFAALDAREASLSREVDLDQRRHDPDGAARAQATLDHLRSRRREIEARMGPADASP